MGVMKVAIEEKTNVIGRRRFSHNRLPVVLFVILLTYFVVLMGGQFVRLSILDDGLAHAEKDLEIMKKHNAALWEKVRLLQSDAYIESLSREQLGLVKPGEIPVVTIKPKAEE